MQSAVRLHGLSKSFGTTRVLDGIDLTIAHGSFTALLGPSGCGKTTLLNTIGGLLEPTAGQIFFGGDLIYSAEHNINVPIEKRNVGFVFQTYALWPHMTVIDNVAYPLKIRRWDRARRRAKAKDILNKLELTTLADRYPYQISGGQQQRVAIARSMVYEPRLLLLDEPLSNLDAQLREKARAWLKAVHASFGLTVLLVTHDQSEALSLSDHVVLLSKGRIEQQGGPEEIYNRPRTSYAAEFVGASNLVFGTFKDGGALAVNGISIATKSDLTATVGEEACLAIRPQKIILVPKEFATNVPGTLLPFNTKTVLYQGPTYEIVADTPIGPLRVIFEGPPSSNVRQMFLPASECLLVKRSSGSENS
jgi:iron(III) transport system ATP-binding protein